MKKCAGLVVLMAFAVLAGCGTGSVDTSKSEAPKTSDEVSKDIQEGMKGKKMDAKSYGS